MPKRKASAVALTPVQSTLSSFLPSTKQSTHPAKKTKLKEAGSVKEECPSIVECPSTEVEVGSDEGCSSNELVVVMEMIDEVICFAKKPMLWSLIHEEIYSLHKR